MTGFVPFTNTKIQYQNLRHQILDAVDSVLSSGMLVDGSHVKNLARRLSNITGFKYAIPTHSGTIALQILARYFKNKDNPTVCIPAVSFPATANAFKVEGWNISFVDVDNYGISLDPTEDSDLFLPVGLYGIPVDFKKYTNYSGVRLEDGCQSWTAKTLTSDTTAVSFDPMKNISSIGNGGAVLTNDYNLAMFASQYCNHGKHDGSFVSHGSNARMSEVECAIINIKLEHFNQWQARRRQIAQHFISMLHDSNVSTLVTNDNINNHGLQKFVVCSKNRNELQSKLLSCGIETKVHYATPLPMLPHLSGGELPKTSNYLNFCDSVISLPMYPELTDNQVEFIAKSVKQCA